MEDVQCQGGADGGVQPCIDEGGDMPHGGRQNVAAEDRADPSMCRTGGRPKDRAGSCRRDQWNGAEPCVAAQKHFAAVKRDARMVSAEEKLTLTRRRQPLGEMQVHPKSAATRLLVEMCETKCGDVVENAHAVRSVQGTQLRERCQPARGEK